MIEAEKNVIACLIGSSEHQSYILDELKEADFAYGLHRKIFTTAVQLTNNGDEVDIFTIAEKVSDVATLTELVMDNAHFNAKIAVSIVKKESARRKALAGLEMARELVLSADSIDEQREALEKLANVISIDEPDFETLPELVKDAIRRFKDKLDGNVQEGLKTGFTAIDERLGGMQKGDLIVVGARPSMGKTTYAMNIAENVAAAGGKVLVFSLEMTKEAITDRMISSASGLNMSVIRNPKYQNGGFDEDSQQKLLAGCHKIKMMERRISIIDKPALDISHARNIARKFNHADQLDLIIVDYLQLMTCKAESRLDEISKVSRGLKALAKEIKAPVIVLSQLTREVEKRSDKRPINADLRESGQIEQDADIIQFLYRDEVYNEGSNKGLAEVITRKFRNGEIGTDYLESQLHCSRFVSTNRVAIEPEPEYRPYKR